MRTLVTLVIIAAAYMVVVINQDNLHRRHAALKESNSLQASAEMRDLEGGLTGILIRDREKSYLDRVVESLASHLGR